MAANTNLNDKETNNWVKASLALYVTKQGLTNFLDIELNKVHAVVGRSCGNCPIEKLIPCPTTPYCNKKKRNNCPFHKSQRPQPCPTCDNVKQNIILQHRYGGPSWKNTRAEKWTQDYWEIGKCFLPPDGYSSVSSVQESDFNGVISIMLNCKHFQTCLSSAWLSPPPPDKQCPLEKVRQIGRDVRHTANCKVTDADLQDYFQTLSTLLADPNGLQHDPSATIACTRLRDLQNDCTSMKELRELLEEANQTIKQAKEEGERFSEEAKRTLAKALDDAIQFGEQRIESKIHDAEHCLENKIQDGAQRIEYSVQDGIMRMQHATNTAAQVDYERGKEDLRGRLVEHYNDHSSNVPLSMLDQSLDKRITDIYATPKIHRIDIANNGKRVKKEQLLTYKEIFYTDDNKSNRHIYVQGEPGSGKSTFAAKLVHDWCGGNQPSADAPNENEAFHDVSIIRYFKFIFFISLRESRSQTDVTHMIKKQLIDTMYCEHKRDALYKLLHQIIETELCLIVRDGLDEWVAPDGINMAEPSMAGYPKDRCTVLTTSRPWKLADERIKNSQVDILLEIDGIDDPDTFSERILRCILDDSKNLKTTAREIRNFISERELTSLSYSPMLYTLVICTWVNKMEEEEHLKASSLCALWTTLLESLCKKANNTTGYFNDLNPPLVKCFFSTRYLQPIIQIINVMSKAAFHLLFSPEQETSIVFNDHTLSNYVSKSEKEFALKAGLLSQRKTKNISNASISFLHKSMQEFLAAYYIACNAYLIDDVIAGHLTRHKEAHLDISLLFIFLCGLNITAANKLSGMMDEHHDRMINEYCGSSDSFKYFTFHGMQDTIATGYREAVLNEQTNIRLRLSYFSVNRHNFRDIYNIWKDNTSNTLTLDFTNDSVIHSLPAYSDQTCHVEFDLSSCIKLKVLRLEGSCIKDCARISSALPVCVVLNSADLPQYADLPQIFPSIEYIRLHSVTVSSTWVRILYSTLQKLDHEVECQLTECNITSSVDGAVKRPDTKTNATLTCSKNTSNMLVIGNESPSLWEALHGMNIKSLRLQSVNVNHAESMLQSLSSFTQLETLSVIMCDDSPNLWKGLRGLNIKNLSLIGFLARMEVNHVKMLPQSLCSFKHLETLSIDSLNESPGLWKCLRGLNIKNLNLSGWFGWMDENNVELLLQSLSSIKELETLSIDMYDDNLGLREGLQGLNITSLSLNSWFRNLKGNLWMGVYGLNIKSLSLSHELVGFNVNHIESMLESQPSIAHLETLSIDSHYANSGLWKVLRDLNSKSGRFGWLTVNHVRLLPQSVPSLKHLETLTIYMRTFIDIQLPQSLKHFNVYCEALHPSELRKLVDTLSACTRKVESKLEFGCASFNDFRVKPIPPEEYISIKQELESLNHVEVKRFRILDRKRRTAWSVRYIGGVHDDNQDDDNVKDDAYTKFVSNLDDAIINRISMRFLINPASNSVLNWTLIQDRCVTH